MITRRTLLLYNFGIALIFVSIGLLSLVALDPFSNRTILPPFDRASHEAIQEDKDIENLRARATFYFELGRDLKSARYIDSDTLFHDVRSLCFILSAVFTLGGILAFLVTRKPSPARS